MCSAGNVIYLLSPKYSENGFVSCWETNWKYEVKDVETISLIVWGFSENEDKFFYAHGNDISFLKINGDSVLFDIFMFLGNKCLVLFNFYSSISY